MTASWPLVGRRAELQQITAAAAAGERGLVLAGAAGVGKTRLAQEAVETLDPRRFRTAQAVASSSSKAIPFGALAHLLPREAPSQLNRLGWALDALRGNRDGRCFVLLVDDAHLLDEPSAAVVLQLARGDHAFVLVTVRREEPEPDAVRSLWKDGHLRRLELAPLSAAESAEISGAVLGARIDAPTAQRLWRVTRGNPLYLRELLLTGRETGTIVERNGVFRWSGEVAMAPRLAELISHRLGELDADESAALEYVAFGEPIEVSTLAQLSPRSAIESVEDSGLITVEPDPQQGRVRVAHPLYGEGIRARCPKLRTQRRMRDLADSVESSGPLGRNDTVRLAVWRLETGTAHDAELMLTACRIAASAFDMPLATRLGWAAVNAGGGVDAAVLLAKIMNWCSRPTEADAALRAAERDATSDADRAKLASTRAFTLWHGQQRPDKAIQLLTDVERTIEDDAIRQRVLVQHAEVALISGRCLEALRAFDEVVSGPPLTEVIAAQAHGLAGQALGVTGRYTAAIEALDKAPTTEELGRTDPVAELRLVGARYQVHLLAGYLDAAESCLRPVHIRTVEEGDRSLSGFTNWCLGQIARYRGRTAEARDLCQEAAAALQQQSVSGFTPCCLGDLAHSYALAGDLSAATATLADADAERTPGFGLYNYWIDIARTWVHAGRGNTADAVRCALDTAETARDSGLTVFELISLHDAVRLGAADRAADRLLAAAAEAVGPFPAACAEHVTALVSGDGGALLAVADRFAGLGMMLHAAEAAAQAAAGFRTAGRGARSRAAAAKAWSLAEHCEGARTPALADLRAPGLTPSEREVAELAAAGLSSREIADRLTKSVRTVDNHLAHAYDKLGVHSRRELTSILVDSGRPSE